MLYIIRHGKTEWNEVNRLQGRTDVPLNEEGRAMAYAARKEALAIHFDVCYCSPLKRARETAEILLDGMNVPIVFDDRLVEMSFGEYEGTYNFFDDETSPINVIFKHPENYVESIGGSETFDELFARTGEFLDEVVMPGLAEGKDILIAGHGAMNSSIVSIIRNYDRADFWSAGIPNCKLMKLL